MDFNEIHHEVLTFLAKSDGPIGPGSSSFHCVSGCTYMVMSIKFAEEGNEHNAFFFETIAKGYLDMALPGSSQFAAPASTTGTTTDGNAGDKAWRKLEEWLGNYKLWFVRRDPIIGAGNWGSGFDCP